MNQFKIALLIAGIAAGSTCLRAGDAAPSTKPTVTGEQALQRLIDGNKRYASDSATHPNQSRARKKDLASGQNPFAVVLTCADSRVAPELVFDQGMGDLFVIRNAGNVLDEHTLGSIEYAVAHLNVPLIIVMGHEKCGAVKAATAGGHAEGHIQSLVDAIQPAVARCKHQPGDRVDNVVRANAQRVAAELGHIQPILSEAVKGARVKIAAARYDLDSGEVEILR